MEMQFPIIQFLSLFFLGLLSGHSFAASSSSGIEADVNRFQFPDHFLFGTGTSSYQVEGAYLEDGKSLNNWDVFSHIPGNIKNNENGDVADDHYHRFLEDIEIMHSLGVNAYRFSISWARLLPRGRFGEINPSGIMFYNNLIDNLLLRGIEPFVTIYHHDFPQELEDRYGSWLSPLMQEDFVHFAGICFESFGDRVKYWATLNEPNLLTEMAYIRGWYPPSHCSPPFGNCSAGNSDTEPLIVVHNMLLSHAKTVKLYRQQFQARQGGCIGIIANTIMYEPLRDEESDIQAVKRALAFYVGWMLDPLVFGDYPSEMRQYLGSELPRFSKEEILYVKGSIDFIGINHYSSLYAKDCIHSACILGGNRPIRGFVNITEERDGVPIGERTGMEKFFIVPEGMEKMVNYLKERYNNMPIYVTENGELNNYRFALIHDMLMENFLFNLCLGFSPRAEKNEQVENVLRDVKRIEFHKGYLAALARAIENGADVRGYFVWSLMDNFEWIEGYSMRFGFYYVDRQTRCRIPKLSAKWYRSFLTNTTRDNDQRDLSRSSLKRKNVGDFEFLDNKRAEM